MDEKKIVVSAVNANFGYNQEIVVSDVNLTIYSGDSVALIGPNGSGKSTFMKALISDAEKISGEIKVCDLNAKEARKKIGYLPQHITVDKDFPISLRQVVQMGPIANRKSFLPLTKEEKKTVNDSLEMVGLLEQAKKQFTSLSGGQQQRGLLARAISRKPELLLLDEPFNGLDKPNRDKLLEIINNLRNQGTTIITSTHDMQIAEQSCNKVILVNKKIYAFGDVEDTLSISNIEKTFEDAVRHIDDHSVISIVHEHD